MSDRAKPWTKAIEDKLAGGAWIAVSEVIDAGAALVPDDRAELESSRRTPASGAGDAERRLASARRTVASQSLMGMRRFGKVEMSTDKKQVRITGGTSQSLGDHGERIAALERKVETLVALVGRLARGETLSVEEAEAVAVSADGAGDDGSPPAEAAGASTEAPALSGASQGS